MRVILERRSTCGEILNLGTIQPQEICNMSKELINHTNLHCDKQKYEIGECFKVKLCPDDTNVLILKGYTSDIQFAGQSMNAGHLIIDGNAGAYTGFAMQRGLIEIHGNAGDCLGVSLLGGIIRVNGSVGNWCGAAREGESKGMNGGSILINGNAGRELGAYMRRGLIVVGENCDAFAGARMHAGTIICMGEIGKYAGVGMKRGSLVACSLKTHLPGFRPTGKADPGWLRIYFIWLKENGFPIPARWWENIPIRYSGDHLESGKGEILEYDIVE